MIAFKDLNEILRMTITWEKQLKDFYDVAEYAIKDPKAKGMVRLLRERLLEKLEILEGVDVSRFGKTEWVRYAPSYRDEELNPAGRIGRDSRPQEILEHMVEYEEKLKTIYSAISNNLISRAQKELFDSLVLFKEEQIGEARRLMETHSLGR